MSNRLLKCFGVIFSALFITTGVCMLNASAEDSNRVGLSMSPMNQKIVLMPGESYHGSFKINSPGLVDSSLGYVIDIVPFFVDDNYNIKYEDAGEYSEIVDWTTVSRVDGALEPNQPQVIDFVINVPQNAPAGGQYMAINVKTNTSDDAVEGVNMQCRLPILLMKREIPANAE